MMNLDEEVKANFIAHFAGAEVAIDTADGEVIKGKVSRYVRVVRKTSSPLSYDVTFTFHPEVETRVEISSR